MASYGPLIDRTHQAWKLHAANIGVVLSVVIHVLPRWLINGISYREIAIYSGASAAVAASSVFMFFGTVRCPVCGANWVWRAFKRQPIKWLARLSEQQVCPVCGSNGDPPLDDRQSRP